MAERLQKLLARWGIASRRRAEDLIRAGRVSINGQIATLGDQVDPEQDRVEYQGRCLNPQTPPELVYLLLHKPAGVVSTCADPQGRPTVLDILPEPWRSVPGLHPVGRLDFATTGAFILTNDGDLTFKLTHPSQHFPKTYQAWVRGHPTPETLTQWQTGVNLAGQMTLPAQVKLCLTKNQPQAEALLEIVICEGRNRQIRRVAKQLGHPVISLHRAAIGPIELGNPQAATYLPLGAVRILTPAEVTALQNRYNPEGGHPVVQ
ncbi:pseudouridine synthase [Thermosynechococcaceae cyanobacterium BACA0444]|uniref:Pseudouridine synthase n=1 Tax=Pseudocalidococcus azoricus BACA0444 TaxID=2918990 RepID=A0AAE4JUU9_9CYAN|nr:pseudouridine synthase [Pseudocalidococcus azoricus]MDS3859406.1 pseudouridine synthase [Pseudocalidococcus azoricus BACA0444]